MSITPLPAAPSPLDPPDTFNAKAYAFFAALGVFGQEASDLAATVDFTAHDIQAATATAAVAGGTANAITASYTPAITALTNGMTLYVRAAAANATTTPSFTPNSGVIAAKTIVKRSGSALAAGDIAGAGHWIELTYDSTLDKWVLQNPTDAVVSPFPAQSGNAGRALVSDGTAVSWGSPGRVGTAIATTSGAAVGFTGIPSWARRVTLSLSNVSTTGSTALLIQLGTSAGYVTTGYTGAGSYPGSSTVANTSGFCIPKGSSGASFSGSGSIVLTELDPVTNTWAAFGILNCGTGRPYFTSGTVSLPGALDRVRITTDGGVETFDAGIANIFIE